MASAVFNDLNAYSTELSEEERSFKETIGPQLDAVLKA
jgi:hypothetical protein